MSRTLNVNYSDSTPTGATKVTLTVPSLNYGADFRVMRDEPTEAIITNITSPLDQPERIRWAHQNVTDVYRNTGIDPTLYYGTRKGTQVLFQLTDVFSVTDPDDPQYLALLPISAHLVLKVPNNDLLSEEVLMTEISRLLGSLYETSAAGTAPRLRAVLRGALMPTAL